MKNETVFAKYTNSHMVFVKKLDMTSFKQICNAKNRRGAGKVCKYSISPVIFPGVVSAGDALSNSNDNTNIDVCWGNFKQKKSRHLAGGIICTIKGTSSGSCLKCSYSTGD